VKNPLVIFLFTLLSLNPLAAHSVAEDAEPVTKANRALAERFTKTKMEKMIFSTEVEPHWLEGSDRFWYAWESSEGKTFWVVDPARRQKSPIFDNDEIAAQITLLTKDPYDGKHLPIEKIRWVKDNTAIQFDVTSTQDEEVEETEGDQQEEESQKKRKPKKKVHHFEYDLGTRQVRELTDFEAPPEHPEWAAISPDKQWIVFAREHNLFMMDADNYKIFLDKEKAKKEAGEKEEEEEGDEPESDADEDIEEIQLTTDGEEHYSYGERQRGKTDKERAKEALKRQPVEIVWSADSSKFALVRTDRREVEPLWVINAIAEPRPTLETYRYDMAGEKNAAQTEIWVADLGSREVSQIETAGFKDQRTFILEARQFPRPDAEEPIPDLWLSSSSDELYFGRWSRDYKRYDVVRADLATGESRVLIEERLNTYLDIQPVELLSSGEMIWWSERDGWGHYYLYGPDGTLKNRITHGPFSTRGIEGVDEANRVVYFTANGREEEEDPYYTHLYRVNLDGTGLALLNPGDFNHTTSISESNRYFVDNYSQVGTTPAAALHDSSGNKLMDLEEADLSLLFDAGYNFPETFQVKADDGVTDIYGVLYKPFDFDETKRYPLIAYVYPGPQTEAVSKSFSSRRTYNVMLAQFGFIVIEVGNRGGHPARSKWYHNYGYGNLRDYGLADKKVAIEQLAARHDFIDIDRVGIFGHSGGGFMSTAAMLVYPDFFKVAVSSSGNHENQIYNRYWSEKHHGVKEVTDDEGNITFEYDIAKNSELAKNLKGHLLLTTGDIDNNVHPSLTYRMAHALIKANKRFDFFVFPGERHGYRDMADYWEWLRSEYFVKHLLGDEEMSADIAELNREQAMTGKPKSKKKE
jgi:dipeptidyl aminopeptidase/acylaminoacyl peptidase